MRVDRFNLFQGFDLVLYGLLSFVCPFHPTWVPALAIPLGVLVDPLSVLMVNVASGIGLLIMIYSLEDLREEPGLPYQKKWPPLHEKGMPSLTE